MDAQTNTVVAGQYPISESSEAQLLAFLGRVKALGVDARSFTTDGSPSVIKVLRYLWPRATLQRCVVHVQRQGLVWCRSYPRTTYARKLRDIFLRVTRVHTHQERDRFLESVREWESSYGSLITGRPEVGRVFSDIKRARSMLLRALPDMFHYLDDPNTPRSTNGLEGYFSTLKNRYRQHRGIRRSKLSSYFAWYLSIPPK